VARVTFTLDDNLRRALKETAAREGRAMGAIIEECLRLRGIGTRESARTLAERARKRSGLEEGKARKLAVRETRRARHPKAEDSGLN